MGFHMSHYKTDAPVKLSLRALTLCAVASIALLSTATSHNAQAQTQSQADPSRVDERFREPIVDFKVGPQIEVRQADIENAPGGAKKIKLVLQNIEISGNTVYTAEYLNSFYSDKLGTEISLADVYAIAARLTRLYREDDYAISRVVVPVQTIDKKTGTIKLEAVEGFIDQVTIQGEEKGTEFSEIRQYVNLIKGPQPLNIKELERTLLMINDLPGLEARAIMSQSNATAKASDLTLIIERKKVDAVLSIDNHGSRYLGPVQMIGAASFNSWLGLNERFTVQGAIAPDNTFEPEMAYISGHYEQPINKYGTWFKAFLSRTRTDPGYDLKEFDVRGQSTYGEFKIEHPLTRTRNFNWFTNLSFDWRNASSKNNLEPTRKDRVRALRVGTSFEFLDTLFGAGVNSINLKFSKGIDVFGASESGDDNLSREFGDPSFSKMEAQAQRLQRLSSKWNLLTLVKGQLSNSALLSSED
jgi:hemolysin activation/secretion protein